jgi:hypothetical protein
MYLNAAEMNYFIDQAVKGLISFGFSDDDAQFVNMTLDTKFNKRCAPAEAIIPPSAGPQLQPICIAPDCLLSPNATCSIYDNISAPAVANASLLGNYTKDASGRTSFDGSNTTGGVTPTNDAVGIGNSAIMSVYVVWALGVWTVASMAF